MCTDEKDNSHAVQFVSCGTQLKHHLRNLEASEVIHSQDSSPRRHESCPEPENLQDLLKEQEGLDYGALHAGGCDTSTLTGESIVLI